MKNTYEKTIEVNNQLKANVDEQKNDTKYLNNDVIKMIKTKSTKYQQCEPISRECTSKMRLKNTMNKLLLIRKYKQ